jgi:FkbM family methyltransferase
MSYRRALIRALDRPGGRTVAGAIINRLARSFAPGVRVYFRNGMWMHQEKDVTFVDSPTLDYHPLIFPTWANELEHAIANATDSWFHAYQPRPGDFVIDAGAGKGEDTIVFSRAVGPAGKVLSIEAHPVSFCCLRLFCELNHLHNVITTTFAVIDGARPVAMESQKGWQANRLVAIDTKDSLQVSGLSLDELVERENVRRIDFLKMNIEGAEALAIRGMEHTLRITRALCISCHDFRADNGEGEFFRTKHLVQAAVERAGFRILSRDTDPRPDVANQVNAVRDSNA